MKLSYVEKGLTYVSIGVRSGFRASALQLFREHLPRRVGSSEPVLERLSIYCMPMRTPDSLRSAPQVSVLAKRCSQSTEEEATYMQCPVQLKDALISPRLIPNVFHSLMM